MKRNQWDHYGEKNRQPESLGPLFETAETLKEKAIQRGLAGQSETARLLEPVILELAYNAGRTGITADDVRRKAEELGITPDDKGQRTWSFLAGLMGKLLVATRDTRKSSRPESHANRLVVWIHRRYAEAA